MKFEFYLDFPFSRIDVANGGFILGTFGSPLDLEDLLEGVLDEVELGIAN